MADAMFQNVESSKKPAAPKTTRRRI